MQAISKGGCGSGSCGCGAPAAAESLSTAGLTHKGLGWLRRSAQVTEEPAQRAGDTAQSAQPPEPPCALPQASKKINGITLVAPDGAEAYTDWLELAHTELLRQEAVASGFAASHCRYHCPRIHRS